MHMVFLKSRFLSRCDNNLYTLQYLLSVRPKSPMTDDASVGSKEDSDEDEDIAMEEDSLSS